MDTFTFANRAAPSVFQPVYVVPVFDGMGEPAGIPDHLAYTGNLAPISTELLKAGSDVGMSAYVGRDGKSLEYLMYSGNLPVLSKQFYRGGVCVCIQLSSLWADCKRSPARPLARHLS